MTSALNRMQVAPPPKRSAPLADAEDLAPDQGEQGGGYAVPKDQVVSNGGSDYAQPMGDGLPRPKPRSRNRERRERLAKIDYSDSDSDTSSSERPPKKPGGVRKTRKKRSAIPVATPVVPSVIPVLPIVIAPIIEEEKIVKEPTQPTEEIEKSQIEEETVKINTPTEEQVPPTEKQKKKIEKELKTKQKEMAKQEKKDKEKEERENKAKVKEERKKDKQDKKSAARSNMKANSVQGQPAMEDFRASDEDPIPVFLSICINFIEKEGLLTEGLYRVPGNRAHVDLLFQKFDEDQNVDITELDVAVNAVATAVKDLFFKRLPPLLPAEHMVDLEQISVMPDRHMRLLEIKKLLERMPRANHAVLKFIFQHFVRVSERSKVNCMDSKNLAICWWPTLLQYEFGDLAKFEMMRPHLEEVVQTFIDQYRFLFCGLEEVMMV